MVSRRGHDNAVFPAPPRLPSGAGVFSRVGKCAGLLAVFLLVLLGSLSLSGCNTSALYKDELYNPPVYWGRHVVQRGETLYSIAWRYGRDYRELGNANGIGPPWHLKAGQVLRLDLRGKVVASQQAKNSGKVAGTKNRSSSVAVPRATPASAPRPAVTRKSTKQTPLAVRTQTVARVNWRWPHLGTIIAKYSSSGKVNKGIDIAGKAGDAVRAAASGNVVYAGNGLLGYGNLIIVNHNEHYLSAYAHNRKILVQEGEDVKAGQIIAELGSSGAERPKLHFEIRKDGNPVNPAHYLPPR